MVVGLTALAFTATRAFAVEGGLGRPISGMQIAPFAGVIPPKPGLAVAIGETYYEGSIGGGRTVPNSRSSGGERRYESVVYTNRVVLHLAHADEGVEFCFGGQFSTGLARGRGKPFPWPVLSPEKRQHLWIVRSGFYSHHSKPSL
jgi:hypothetical protein